MSSFNYFLFGFFFLIMAFMLSRKFLNFGRVVSLRVFGKKNLLLTNCLISAVMGTVDDYIQQQYDLIKNKNDSKSNHYQFKRSFDMNIAGISTGMESHY